MKAIPQMSRMRACMLVVSIGVVAAWLGTGCTQRKLTLADSVPGEQLERRGDEIIVCGQLFHTGAPVVLWTDPGGYDAYRTERRFAPADKASYNATTQEAADLKAAGKRVPFELSSPARFGLRRTVLTTQEAEQVRGGGWPLELLQEHVDQFVYHYDVAGTSRQCFKILHDMRGLSVHFMLDIDGTIYQTLDLKERAWHATTSNTRSIGIEIANMGAYAMDESDVALRQWYKKDENGQVHITIPAQLGDGGVRTPNFIGHPIRNELQIGPVQGKTRRQYDLTPQQYDSLIKLTATLCTVFPKIKCDYPRDAQGQLITHALDKQQLDQYQGLIGHYHIQKDKSDPGNAFQWDKIVEEARKLMRRHDREVAAVKP